MSLIFMNLLILFSILNVQTLKTPSGYHPKIDYCMFNCNLKPHIVCERKNYCGPEPGCEFIPMTPESRREVLHIMNRLRNLIASGTFGSNYQNPGATNMHVLNYDLELEYIAACWANTCKFAIDQCRWTYRFKVGQLMAQNKEMNFRDLIWDWTKNVNKMRYDMVNHWMPFGNASECTSCFTTLVWATTHYVGCAISHLKDGFYTFVCNFGPRGSIPDRPVYHIATESNKAGSECKEKNKEYPSLCGHIHPIPVATLLIPGTGASAETISLSNLSMAFSLIFGNWIVVSKIIVNLIH